MGREERGRRKEDGEGGKGEGREMKTQRKAIKSPLYWFLVSKQNHSLLFSAKQGKLSVFWQASSTTHYYQCRAHR